MSTTTSASLTQTATLASEGAERLVGALQALAPTVPPIRGPPARARRRHGLPGGPGRGCHPPRDARRAGRLDGAGRARGD